MGRPLRRDSRLERVIAKGALRHTLTHADTVPPSPRARAHTSTPPTRKRTNREYVGKEDKKRTPPSPSLSLSLHHSRPSVAVRPPGPPVGCFRRPPPPPPPPPTPPTPTVPPPTKPAKRTPARPPGRGGEQGGVRLRHVRLHVPQKRAVRDGLKHRPPLGAGRQGDRLYRAVRHGLLDPPHQVLHALRVVADRLGHLALQGAQVAKQGGHLGFHQAAALGRDDARHLQHGRLVEGLDVVFQGGPWAAGGWGRRGGGGGGAAGGGSLPGPRGRLRLLIRHRVRVVHGLRVGRRRKQGLQAGDRVLPRRQQHARRPLQLEAGVHAAQEVAEKDRGRVHLGRLQPAHAQDGVGEGRRGGAQRAAQVVLDQGQRVRGVDAVRQGGQVGGRFGDRVGQARQQRHAHPEEALQDGRVHEVLHGQALLLGAQGVHALVQDQGGRVGRAFGLDLRLQLLRPAHSGRPLVRQAAVLVVHGRRKQVGLHGQVVGQLLADGGLGGDGGLGVKGREGGVEGEVSGWCPEKKEGERESGGRGALHDSAPN